MSPCAVRIRPDPTATGPALSVATSSSSSAAQTPTTSAMESQAPTSWKCTSSTSVPCTRALGVGEPAEDGQHPGAHPGGQVRHRHQVADLAPPSVRQVLGAELDVDLATVLAGPQHGPGLEPDRARDDLVHRMLHRVEVGAGVDERSEQHVAGDAGRGVDPGVDIPRAHGEGAAICAAR